MRNDMDGEHAGDWGGAADGGIGGTAADGSAETAIVRVGGGGDGQDHAGDGSQGVRVRRVGSRLMTDGTSRWGGPWSTATANEVMPKIEYRVASLRALKTLSQPDGEAVGERLAAEPARIGAAGSDPESPREVRNFRKAPSLLSIDDEPVVTTPRFWWSLFVRCGLNEAVFRYFDPAEVFNRVARLDAGRSVRFAIERSGPAGSRPRLLAVSSPNGPLLHSESAASIVESFSGTRVAYSNGVLSSMHRPAGVDEILKIGPDGFRNRFHLEVPVDGMGEPRIHIALVRLVCSNGAIGMRAAFRSTIRIGKDPEHSLDRALAHYANDDGFSAMRQRFDSAQRSWASLREVRLLENELNRISWGTTDGARERRRAFRQMVGDYESRYGIASIEALSVKRQRMLQSSCRMYDLINFATEIATHHAPPHAAGRLQSWLGSTITEEYDLENTANEVPDFAEVFTDVGGGMEVISNN